MSHDSLKFSTVGTSMGITAVGVAREDSKELDRVLSKFTLSGDTVRSKLDDFLRGVVAERCKDLNVEKRVADALERRVEVACSAAMRTIDSEVSKIVSRMVTERVREVVAAMPIVVHINGVSGPAADTVKKE